MLARQEHHRWIEDKYKSYRRRIYAGWAVLLNSIPVIGVGVLFLDSPFDAILILSSLGLYYAGVRVTKTSPPPVEDRTILFLGAAVTNLKLLVDREDGSIRKACLKNLKKARNALDDWRYGNVKFIVDGVGKKLKKFRDSFRERLIPAAESAGRQEIMKLLSVLESLENAFEMGYIDETRLDTWNALLEQYPPVPSKPPLLSKLGTTKNLVLAALVSLCVVAPYATYRVATEILGISVDTAFNGALVVLAIVVGSWTTYMGLRRQRTCS